MSKSYTIYKITDGKDTYVGMTTQSMATRLQQHKKDALNRGCSLTSKLCQKKLPTDLAKFHRVLRKDPHRFVISKLETVTGTYEMAHTKEGRIKRRLSTF